MHTHFPTIPAGGAGPLVVPVDKTSSLSEVRSASSLKTLVKRPESLLRKRRKRDAGELQV